MACSKFSQDPLLEMLRFCSRDQLERHSIISRQLKSLIAKNFQSKPYRVFDQLYVSCGECEYLYSLYHKQIQWYPNKADYNVQQFLDGIKCDQSDLSHKRAHYSLSEMLPYLAQSVRIKITILTVTDDSIIVNPKLTAEMETIAHLWSDQEIGIIPNNFYQYFTDAKILQIQPILNPDRNFYVRAITLWNPDLSFNDCPMLYSTNILYAVYTSSPFKNPMNVLYFLEKPRAKPLTLLDCYSWNASISLLIDLIFQGFSSALIVSAFRLIIIFYEEEKVEPSKEFRIENRITREVLQFKKITDKRLSTIPVNTSRKKVQNIFLWSDLNFKSFWRQLMLFLTL